MPENQHHSEIIGTLVMALNKLALYPATHPIIKSTLEHTYAALNDYLKLKKDLTFSLSADDKILVEGALVTSSSPALLNGFISEFKKLQAESITFSLGLTLEEVESFLKIMLLKTEDLKNKGDVNQILNNTGIRNIKVNLFSYVKVEAGMEVGVVEAGKETAVAEKDEGIIKDINLRAKELLEGKLDEESRQNVKKELFSSFSGDYPAFIKLINEVVENAKHLSEILELVGDASVKETKEKDIKSKVDYAKMLLKLSLQLKKIIPQLKDVPPPQELKSLIDTNSAKYVKEILLDAACAEYSQKKVLTADLKNILKILLSKTGNEEKNNIFLALKGAFLQNGLSENDVGSFISHTEEFLSKSEEKKAEKIDREEIEHIKEENAQLIKELVGLRGELEKDKNLRNEYKKVSDEKERVENIIRHMAEGLVVVDSEGKVLLMNPAAEKLLNVKKEDMAGKPLQDNIKDEHLLTVTKNLAADKDGNLTKEIELLSPNESTKKILRTSSAVVENQDGKTVGMVTVLNDITKQKEIESLKSSFVANVSHELRTPLVVIQQSLSILNSELADKLNEDQKKFFGNTQNNLLRLRNLINDLLDMASFEAGKLKLKPGLFDINEIVNSVVEFLAKWAGTKNITLEGKILPTKAELYIDKDRVIQVITNLVSNAIKFTPEGGKITVALNERMSDERFSTQAVEVSVIDTGIGIEAKDIGRLFNKFEQVNPVNHAQIRGTGLGLAIAKEIVQLHNGKIWVESKIGEGSKFTFLLPKNSNGGS